MQSQNRRTFLKCAGAAAMAAGLSGCATGADKTAIRPGANLRVRVDAPEDPLVDRAFAILKNRIEERCSTRVVRSDSRAQLVLAVDPNLPFE
ncbi:MAG: twin-arginine translocation signal domain-containing protein, partial [FCB group bacterium]|nr:twin-arginine translocation signal domain-containing protein [FCB group bacterium]